MYNSDDNDSDNDSDSDNDNLLMTFRGTIELLEEALAIRQRLLGPTHLQCSSILNQLGKLYCSSGMYAKSKQAVCDDMDTLACVHSTHHSSFTF